MAAEIVRVQGAVLGALSDGTTQSISDAAIVMEKGRVSAVGSADEIRRKYPRAKVTHFKTGTAFPGLINGHHHIGVTTFQHGVADGPLSPGSCGGSPSSRSIHISTPFTRRLRWSARE